MTSKHTQQGTRSIFPERSLGIEITDHEVRWVEVKQRKNLTELITFDDEPLPEGAVDDGRIVQAGAVIQAIQTLKQRTKTRRKPVHLLLPSTLTMVRFLKLPDVPMKDLRKLVDFELRFNLPLPFERPYYDVMKLPTPAGKQELPAEPAALQAAESPELWDFGMQEAAAAKVAEEPKPEKPIKQCEVMVAAASLDTIEEYTALLTSAGLRPKTMEIKALSLFRVVERFRPIDPQLPFVLIDITSTYADIGIYHEGALRIARNKPIRFPKKPAKAEAEDEAAANWRQLEFQSASQDLASEIERFINFYYYTLNNREYEIRHMLISGDVYQLNLLVETLQGRFPFDIQEFRVESLIAHHLPRLNLIRHVAPLGLALRRRSE